MKKSFDTALTAQQQQPALYTPEEMDIRARQAAMQEDARAMAPGVFHDDGSYTPADTAQIISLDELRIRAA